MKLPKNSAEQILLDFIAAYNERDLTKIMALFMKTANLWGTGLDEYRTGHTQIEAQIKRDWAQSDRGHLTLASPISTGELNENWAAAILNATIEIDNQIREFEHLRITIFLEEDGDNWKTSHMHCSFPDSRQDHGKSFPLI